MLSNKNLGNRLQIYYLILLLIISITLISCGNTRHLERVAKDWCMNIRASQVIPVYPLTEDIQPGDVFLVQTPLEEQVKVYKSKGFLPLDNHLIRLQPTNYCDFYSGGYDIIDKSIIPPRHWQFKTMQTLTTDYANAPRAAFPSYIFSVSRSEGFNMALPVHGIPIALNLLDSVQARGCITITDSYTYGTDLHGLEQLVRKWANENTDFLGQFAPPKQVKDSKNHFANLVNEIAGKTKSKRTFLRVVNRVYLTGRVNISLFNDEAFGSTVSGSVPSPVNLMNLNSTTNATENFNMVNKILNNAAGGTQTTAFGVTPAIDGTLKLLVASSRSVTLVESFPRPLVIGYIAFDLPIQEGGKLGSPVSTQLQLTKERVINATPYRPDKNTKKISDWLDSNKENKKKLNEWLKKKETQDWLKKNGCNQVVSGEDGITNILYGNYSQLREKIVRYFKIQ